MKTSEKSLKFEYYDSPYVVYVQKPNTPSAPSQNPFMTKKEERKAYNKDDFNTTEMRLFNDLQIIEDTVKLVSGALADNRKNHLFYEKV